MASLIDGLVLPTSRGGHPALDFCNTRAGWAIETPKEYLVDYRHLTGWAYASGLLTASAARSALRSAAADPAAAQAVVAAALDLRSSLYDVLAGPASARSWRLVAAAASAAAAAAELTRPAPMARWEIPTAAGPRLPLLAVARSAADLLTSAEVTAISSCPMPDCGWLFLDPRGRRTWCSMAVCGNRAKARRYAAKQRG